ncbi:membrane-bound metal-dependent hydrolase [Azotobacter vinelandii CA]|uniref:Membrane-bound metal-dependent hydrolase n=2 Tax=Azotobacter vinelandii TaxID=354 RepID=C1DQI7_AZOVD|nr:metal-dependent hydrolase [Azotobacter vinelandii]ACO79623.1 membrane-bound metal-dependent hydrolase [Azotobacter vinelandii DJ]AGK14632.1 membrane-bound metal-dependent hydrolase [Azotobacter vinelandii CA]AGK21365.1 membrane-bound metal-dependent hydrolase [Azotobacter vinelandii CA6]SFX24846.1 inner membrane protein [Azotobacter vinelandii]GLK57986.1 integral membrane protein [Azotobacter vinelandii]
MDSLTQAVLGASVQGALLGRWQGRKALLYGALLGTLPDLDVLIDYGDAVANMTRHRGFSHSLFVLTGFSLLLAWLLRRFRPHPGYGGGRLFLALWLVLATHVLLDSLTSYGTQLLWPLDTPPVAWSSVFIVDPLYTLPLLGAVLGGVLYRLRGRALRWQYWALGLSSLYLGLTLAGKQMAENRVAAELARQGIRAEALFSTPTPFNSLLWRVLARDGEDYHEALVGWFDRRPPELVRLPRGTALIAGLGASPQLARLRWFADDWLRYDEIDGKLVVTDLRLGMTGAHPFRFALAAKRDGRWQLLPEPEQLPMNRGRLEHLGLLWRRIWHQDARIPLEDWARQLQQWQAPLTASPATPASPAAGTATGAPLRLGEG